MQNTTKLKVGDTVHAVFAWTENVTPTDKNFFTGKVKSIIRKPSGAVYFVLEKLDRQLPAEIILSLGMRELALSLPLGEFAKESPAL